MSNDENEQPWDPFKGWSKAQREKPMSIHEAADALGVKRQTFRLWAVTGRIPAFRVGAGWMVTPAAVIADITRDRGMFARSDTSVVYCALQRKLQGSPAPEVEWERRPQVERRPPGLIEPQPPAARGSDAESLQIVVDVAGLAKILGCSTALIHRMAKDNQIPSFKLGSRKRFEVRKVLDALQKPVELWQQPARSLARKRIR